MSTDERDRLIGGGLMYGLGFGAAGYIRAHDPLWVACVVGLITAAGIALSSLGLAWVAEHRPRVGNITGARAYGLLHTDEGWMLALGARNLRFRRGAR